VFYLLIPSDTKTFKRPILGGPLTTESLGEDSGLKTIEGFQGAAFGLADGVICILGMIVGVAAATNDLRFIIIAAVTGGIADALGNSFGFYLSEMTERGAQINQIIQGKNTSAHSMREVLVSGILSFVATAFVVVILLVPFFFTTVPVAVFVASAEAILVLFLLGYYVGRLSRESPIKMAVRYVFVGAIGAILSYFIGEILRDWVLAL
jgi:predicted membrane protein (TIGR00267 family)